MLIPLSKAKDKFSEVVRTVRESGESAFVTLDGSPAVEIRPVYSKEPRRLSNKQIEHIHFRLKKITEALDVLGIEPFNAVDLVNEGRR